jgi:hypothetical protein
MDAQITLSGKTSLAQDFRDLRSLIQAQPNAWSGGYFSEQYYANAVFHHARNS